LNIIIDYIINMEKAFEQQPILQKEVLLQEMMANAKENLFKPQLVGTLTGSALEEMRDEEQFEAELLANEEQVQRWVNQLSPYTQTLAKDAYQTALAQEDQFKDFGKTLNEIFWDEFKLNLRKRFRQQLNYKEAA